MLSEEYKCTPLCSTKLCSNKMPSQKNLQLIKHCTLEMAFSL